MSLYEMSEYNGTLIYTEGLGTLIYTEGMGTSVTLSETLHHCIMVKGSSRCIEHLTARGFVQTPLSF